MSACDPHPQVISPCADDAAASLLGLGTRGDVAFSEYGNMPLTAGQTEIEITFNYEKTDWRYVFGYLYVGYFDGTPIDAIVCSPGSQTTKKFLVKLSGAPTTEDAILFWHARIPDSLQACQSVTNSPKYAILGTEQHGVTPLVSGQDYITVEFAEAFSDLLFEFENFFVRKAFSEADPLGFIFTETARTTTSVTFTMSGAPDNSDYTLHWKARQ